MFGYRITSVKRFEVYVKGDIVISKFLQEARSSIFSNCPDSQYIETYHQHEIGAWGPIPVLVYLVSKLRPKGINTPKVLDIGCAFGTLLAYCSNLGFRTYGIDFVPLERYLGIKTKEKYHINYYQLSIEKDPLPFPGGEFDMVIMTEVLEHFHFQPLDVLNKVYRVLKKDGLLLLTAPALGTTWSPQYYKCPFEEIPSFSKDHESYEFSDKHMKIYDKEELSRLLSKAGFDPFVGLNMSPITMSEHLYAVAIRR